MSLLHERFPELKLSRLELGQPSPVREVLGLWVKDEGHTAPLYAGNKVRKLAWLLPEAERRGGLVSVGAIGSHHLLACAVHGRARGIPVHAVVFPQPETPHVLENLACLERVATSVTRVSSELTLPTTALAVHRREGGYLVGPGGSMPLGTLGWVEGGLELAGQVAAGELPEPSRVVVPYGSGATAVGLALGLKLAGLQTRVVAVRVVGAAFANTAVLRFLTWRTRALLAAEGVELPDGPPHLEVDHDWVGPGYGHPTIEGEEALSRAAQAGLKLDPTYTAKAFAAAWATRRAGPVLFLNTLSALPLPAAGED